MVSQASSKSMVVVLAGVTVVIEQMGHRNEKSSRPSEAHVCTVRSAVATLRSPQVVQLTCAVVMA